MRKTAVILATLALAPELARAQEGGGMSLEEVVAAAQKGPRMRAARESTNEARGDRSEAEGSRFPRFEIDAFVAPSPEIRCLDLACTDTDPDNPTISLEAGVFGRVEATVIQPLYTFGKLSAAREASDSAVRAARSLEGVTAAEVAMQAVEAYYGLKLARESRWMLEEGRERVEQALERINQGLEAGSAELTLQDRYRLESLAAEVDYRLAEARGQEARARAGIQVLVGDDDAEVEESPLEPVAIEPGSRIDYVSRARTGRPEVIAAAAAKRAARELANLENARYFPDVVLVGTLNLARAQGVDPAPSAFADDPFNTVSAGAAVALRWDLDPLAQRGRVEKARAQARRAAHLYAAAGRQADFQTREAYAELAQRREQLEVARRGEKSARAWLASTLQAEAIGAVDSKDLADAYLATFTARARTLRAIHDWNLAVYKLRTATGEFPASPGV